MKTIRIEICVTAFVHVGEDLEEGRASGGEYLPPEGVPVRVEEMTVRRVVQLDAPHVPNVRDSSHVYATAKAHAISILSGIAGVMPDKLAHGAREIASL